MSRTPGMVDNRRCSGGTVERKGLCLEEALCSDAKSRSCTVDGDFRCKRHEHRLEPVSLIPPGIYRWMICPGRCLIGLGCLNPLCSVHHQHRLCRSFDPSRTSRRRAKYFGIICLGDFCEPRLAVLWFVWASSRIDLIIMGRTK